MIACTSFRAAAALAMRLGTAPRRIAGTWYVRTA